GKPASASPRACRSCMACFMRVLLGGEAASSSPVRRAAVSCGVGIGAGYDSPAFAPHPMSTIVHPSSSLSRSHGFACTRPQFEQLVDDAMAAARKLGATDCAVEVSEGTG